MAVYLVCEGLRGGLDDRVLDALVVQFHRLAVLIEPAGGSKGHGAVRYYLQSRSSHPPDVAIAVEDRDFKPLPGANATWANLAGSRFVWRRHEIENYLLQPPVILELFNSFRAAGEAWASSLPGTAADTSALMQALAVPLLEDHAAEILRCELVEHVNGFRLAFGPSTPRGPAGAHFAGQAEWLPALLQEATRLCQMCNAAAALPELQAGAITARAAFLAQLRNPAYLTSGDYLVEMGGKELLESLARHLRGLGAPSGLNRDKLADELLRVLIPIYQPGIIHQPDDFAELAAILSRHCPSPPALSP